MTSTQIGFSATAHDLADVLSSFETNQPCQYTLCGLFVERASKIIRSYKKIPYLGIGVHPTAAANPAYLVSLDGEKITIREVEQKGAVPRRIERIRSYGASGRPPGGPANPDASANARASNANSCERC